MPISIRKGTLTLAYKQWLFPDGAIGVRLDTENLRFLDGREQTTRIVNGEPRVSISPVSVGHTTLWARLQSAADIVELVMLVDALRRWDETPLHLVLPCAPYSRQDRVGVPGEAHSLKAFATLINGLGFEKVTIFDAHSDVTGAVFDRVNLIDQRTILGRFDALNARLASTSGARPVLVSPDKGAAKKVEALAAHYGLPVVYGDKRRDLATGKLTGFVVHAGREEIEGRNLLVVDDLCDAGGTFLGLVTELRKHAPASVALYTTHGLYTKGTDLLYNGGIDTLWTTNSFYDTWPAGISDKVNTLKLEDVFTL